MQNHYEMGKHYGDLLYKTGEDLSSVIKLSKEQELFGQECLPVYEKNMNEIMMEIRGLADGLHQKYEDVVYWLFNGMLKNFDKFPNRFGRNN